MHNPTFLTNFDSVNKEMYLTDSLFLSKVGIL